MSTKHLRLAKVIRPRWLGPHADEAPTGTDESRASALLDLEPLIRNLERMAMLAANEANDLCGQMGTDRRAELTVFATNHVSEMIGEFREEYYRVLGERD